MKYDSNGALAHRKISPLISMCAPTSVERLFFVRIVESGTQDYVRTTTISSNATSSNSRRNQINPLPFLKLLSDSYSPSFKHPANSLPRLLSHTLHPTYCEHTVNKTVNERVIVTVESFAKCLQVNSSGDSSQRSSEKCQKNKRCPHICAYIQVLFVPSLFAAFLIAYVYKWYA
ncbi:hypothetical protein IW261DRAFT_7321 [Armillaria novae-zelandiae]|uniref:Uncharacterized protein n=1 Tax=Armillaria novae-zelandiae TaxID=153914 RepID=A0AA39UJI4_9AGAR|nr:hypothetical protein IW261DRAFT_7321 [Armillaria novae-zelandiae]